MSKPRAAIVGAGFITAKKHIPAYLRLKNKVDLVALCDLNTDAASRIATQFGIPKVYSDLGELLVKENPDLLSINTPPRTHCKVAVQALRHGTNVLIEKPMAMSVAECDEIIKEASASGAKVCVCHSNLFYDSFMKAQDLVKQGVIGDIRAMRLFHSTPVDEMTSRPDHWAHKLPGGVFGETGPHVVYMTLAFINPIQSVAVEGRKILDYPWSRYEDYRIDLVGEKATCSATMIYTSDHTNATVDIWGSKGALLLDLQTQSIVKYSRPDLNPIRIGLSELGQAINRFGSIFTRTARYASGRIPSTHELLIGQFVDSITNARPSPVPPENGREAVRVMNLIVEKLNASAGKPNATVG